jgi:hypothetical protein
MLGLGIELNVRCVKVGGDAVINRCSIESAMKKEEEQFNCPSLYDA